MEDHSANRPSCPGPPPPAICATEPPADNEIAETLSALTQALSQLANNAGPPVICQPAAASPGGQRLVEVRARVHARRENARDGMIKTQSRAVIDIPLARIDPTFIVNIRQTEDEAAFAALCASLQTEGQLQAVVVVEDPRRPGCYYLVAGFRRYRAMAQSSSPTIKATVLPAGTDEALLYFTNTVENAIRFRLTDYEVAERALLMMSRFDVSAAEFARRIGYSESRIENLVRFRQRLPPDVVEDWRNGHHLLSTAILEKLVALDHDSASLFWASWKTRVTKSLGPQTSDQGRLRRSFGQRPSAAKLMALSVALKRHSDLDERVRALALLIVDYTLGIVPAVVGVFDPRRIHVDRTSRKRIRPKEVESPGLAFPDREHEQGRNL